MTNDLMFLSAFSHLTVSLVLFSLFLVVAVAHVLVLVIVLKKIIPAILGSKTAFSMTDLERAEMERATSELDEALKAELNKRGSAFQYQASQT